jgi:hypothetical protein
MYRLPTTMFCGMFLCAARPYVQPVSRITDIARQMTQHGDHSHADHRDLQ